MSLDEINAQKCCICKKPFFGLGNNPNPIKTKGKCCNKCNIDKVLPTRLGLLK